MSVLVVGGIFREVLDADSTPRPRMGGSGLTAAIVAARLGAQTKLASYVGAEDAEAVFAMLDTANVDRVAIAVLPGASGTFVFPTKERAGQPWPMYRPAEAVPASLPSAGSADVALIFGIPDIDAIQAGSLMLGADGLLVWDRQGFLSRARDWRGAAALEPRRKVYLANLDEAQEEFPASSAEETVAQLPPAGFAAAVVKCGAHGCIVIESERTNVPGFPVDVHSTIGSGDAFAGALAAGLDSGLKLASAARRANAAAAAFLEAGDALAEGFVERVAELVESPPPTRA